MKNWVLALSFLVSFPLWSFDLLMDDFRVDPENDLALEKVMTFNPSELDLIRIVLLESKDAEDSLTGQIDRTTQIRIDFLNPHGLLLMTHSLTGYVSSDSPAPMYFSVRDDKGVGIDVFFERAGHAHPTDYIYVRFNRDRQSRLLGQSRSKRAGYIVPLTRGLPEAVLPPL